MPKRFTGKLCKFLASHLDKRTFGNRLEWLDRKGGRFRIAWKHGNIKDAAIEDYAVFMAWDKLKNRKAPRERTPSRKKQCHDTGKKKKTVNEEGPEAKQRFRSALRKMKFQVASSAQSFQEMLFPPNDLQYIWQKELLPASPSTSELSDELDNSTGMWSDDSSIDFPQCSPLKYSDLSPRENNQNANRCCDPSPAEDEIYFQNASDEVCGTSAPLDVPEDVPKKYILLDNPLDIHWDNHEESPRFEISCRNGTVSSDEVCGTSAPLDVPEDVPKKYILLDNPLDIHWDNHKESPRFEISCRNGTVSSDEVCGTSAPLDVPEDVPEDVPKKYILLDNPLDIHWENPEHPKSHFIFPDTLCLGDIKNW